MVKAVYRHRIIEELQRLYKYSKDNGLVIARFEVSDSEYDFISGCALPEVTKDVSTGLLYYKNILISNDKV